MESPPAFERAHRTGKDKKPDGTPKSRTVVFKLYDCKKREAILKTARRIKPRGIHSYEDLAEGNNGEAKRTSSKIKTSKG